MKCLLALTALLGTIVPATAATAQMTYSGSRTVNSETANVTLTTDGTIGVLTANNILSFNVDFTGSTGIASISGNSSNLDVIGSDLTATADYISFDFSAANNNDYSIFALVGSGARYENDVYCVQTISGCISGDVQWGQETTNTIDAPGAGESISQTGNVNLFSRVGDVPALPEPATWAMMLLGFGAIGWVMRRKSSRSALSQLA